MGVNDMATKRTTRKKNAPKATPKRPAWAPVGVRLVEEIEWTDEDEAAADRAMAELYGDAQTPPVAPSPSPTTAKKAPPRSPGQRGWRVR